MSHQAEPTPSGTRARCTAGFHGHSCKKRTCSICGLVWAKDWRVVLFANLKHKGGFVMLSAVTPPGKDGLPWDEAYCAHFGPHSHDPKRFGCRVDPDALAQWSHDISKRWKRLHNAARNAVKRKHGRCLPLLLRVWEPQKRGAAHVHPVFSVPTPADVILEKEIAESMMANLLDQGRRRVSSITCPVHHSRHSVTWAKRREGVGASVTDSCCDNLQGALEAEVERALR